MGFVHGSVYQSVQKLEVEDKQIIISSPEMIINVLSKTKFMKKQQGLFKQNLEQNAQRKVDMITEDLLNKVKDSFIDAATLALTENANNSSNKKAFFQNLNNQLEGCQDIKKTIQIFKIPSSLLIQYQKNVQNFQIFNKISNVVRVEEKLAEANEKLRKKINEVLKKFISSDIEQLKTKVQEIIKNANQKEEQLKKLENEFKDSKNQSCLKMNDHLGNRHKKNYVVEALLRNLSYHPDGPCRNKIGITFNDHFSKITKLKIGGIWVYKVVQFKDNGFSNFITLGIRAGMVTGCKYYSVNENNEQSQSSEGDQQGWMYITDYLKASRGN